MLIAEAPRHAKAAEHFYNCTLARITGIVERYLGDLSSEGLFPAEEIHLAAEALVAMVVLGPLHRALLLGPQTIDLQATLTFGIDTLLAHNYRRTRQHTSEGDLHRKKATVTHFAASCIGRTGPATFAVNFSAPAGGRRLTCGPRLVRSFVGPHGATKTQRSSQSATIPASFSCISGTGKRSGLHIRQRIAPILSIPFIPSAHEQRKTGQIGWQTAPDAVA